MPLRTPSCRIASQLPLRTSQVLGRALTSTASQNPHWYHRHPNSPPTDSCLRLGLRRLLGASLFPHAISIKVLIDAASNPQHPRGKAAPANDNARLVENNIAG